jgi:hypothetical protein
MRRHRVSPSASPMTGFGGVSSTPRLFASIADASGILDHPHSRMTTASVMKRRRENNFVLTRRLTRTISQLGISGAAKWMALQPIAPRAARRFDADPDHSRRDAGGPRNRLVSETQLLKKPAKIGPNFTRNHTGENRALTMPNIRPDLIRI